MFHDRARLNSLIFNNPVVLPRTSPGFGEVSLAVAELQGGNNEKAAILAEIAVGKDPSLAAGWLAKLAADVFEATADDLRKERAVFCMERALELVPSCRVEIIEFFVANILSYYIEVLCEQAVWDSQQWMDLETQAAQLDAEAMSLDWQATRLRGDAGLLEAAGLVTAFVALFSRRLGTKLISGAASLTAFSEAARRKRDAALFEARGSYLRAAGNALRQEGGEHRMASMLHLVPARDLIELGGQLVRAEGLSPQLLDPAIQGFFTTFETVATAQFDWLRSQLREPVNEAIDGNPTTLQKSYLDPATAKVFKRFSASELVLLTKDMHPWSRATLLWLQDMLPGADKLDGYQLLAYPVPTIRRHGVRGAARIDRDAGINFVFFFVVSVAVLCIRVATGVAGPDFVLGCGCFSGAMALLGLLRAGKAIRRRRLRKVFESALYPQTWFKRPVSMALGGAAGSAGFLPGPPARAASKSGRFGATVRRVVIRTVAYVLFVISLLVLLHHCSTLPPRTSGAASPTPGLSPTQKATPQTVRRATAVSTPDTASPSSSVSPAYQSGTTTTLYAVTRVTTGDTLSIHTRASAGSPVAARLPNGYKGLEIVGEPVMNGTTEWVQVKFGDRTGWAARAFLKPE